MRFLPLLLAAVLSAAVSVAAVRSAGAGSLEVAAELGQTVLHAEETGPVYLRVSLKAAAGPETERRAPLNIALVLDRSGSMSGPRLAAAKDAAAVALSRLAASDTVALIAYNHGVDVLQPAAPFGASYARLKGAIDRLTANGTTALFAGVAEGGREVHRFLSPEKVNRVILLSDGHANVGPSTPRELGELGRELAADGISVTAIGLGLEYNEDLMQRLAAASDGNHAFVESPEDLAGIFNREFGDALSVTARDVEIIIECEEGFRPIRFLGRGGEISGQRAAVKLAQLQARNERYAVLELAPSRKPEPGETAVAAVRTEYLDLTANARREEGTKVKVRVSASRGEAGTSVNKAVMAQVAAQIATEQSEKAVELRDKGDLAGARRVLELNTASIKKQKELYGSGPDAAPVPAIDALTAIEKHSSEAAGNLDKEKWGKTRKALRSEQHKSKVQQSY